jgi:hypothetical protein
LVISNPQSGCGLDGQLSFRLPITDYELPITDGGGHVTIAIAFAAADVQEHALGVDVAGFQVEPFTQPQAAGVKGDQGHVMIHGHGLVGDLVRVALKVIGHLTDAGPVTSLGAGLQGQQRKIQKPEIR